MSFLLIKDLKASSISITLVPKNTDKNYIKCQCRVTTAVPENHLKTIFLKKKRYAGMNKGNDLQDSRIGGR